MPAAADTLACAPSHAIPDAWSLSSRIPEAFTQAPPVLRMRMDGDSAVRHPSRIWWLGGTMLAGNAAIMSYYFATYYNLKETERTRWHTFNDWYNGDMNVDKLGHMYGTQMYANTLFHAFRWAELDEEDAMWWSSGVAFAFNVEMEITDGFYKRWGFSWWDIGSNAVGAVWPNLQRIWTPLQSVNLKMSWLPSANMHRGWQTNPMADYDGYTYWLALTVDDVLPEAVRPWWPDWLGVAVGYGVSNTMVAKNGYNNDRDGHGAGTQEWYLALDYDLRRLPGESGLWKFLKEMLNLIHLPAPAVRFSPCGAVWYGLYF